MFTGWLSVKWLDAYTNGRGGAKTQKVPAGWMTEWVERFILHEALLSRAGSTEAPDSAENVYGTNILPGCGLHTSTEGTYLIESNAAGVYRVETEAGHVPVCISMEHDISQFRAFKFIGRNRIEGDGRIPVEFHREFSLLDGKTVFRVNLGQDFFPAVDAGQFKIHVRARTGTRIEETAALCDHIDATIRQHVPAKEIVNIVDNIGLPYSGLNLSYSTSAPIGPADADIQVQLTAEHHPTDEYVTELREVLARQYPGVTFYALPVDIVTQILNFGLSAPIDIQIIGPNLYGNRVLAEHMLEDVRHVPGAVDSRIQQPFDYPNMTVNVDRTRASSIGLTQQNVAQSVLVALSGSFQTSPNFYLDPKNGVSYNIATQTPQYGLDTMAALQSLPITASASAQQNPSASALNNAATTAPGVPHPIQVLGNVATIEPGAELGVVSHYDVQPVLDIFANVNGNDLGTVTRAMDRILEKHRKELPRGSQFILRGQSDTMRKSYVGLIGGLAMSILLVYLLIVVNFQSWLDPFLIISALPAAIAGIVWFLFLTNTHLSVPALTGAIMCMGVATANSILVVSFAREQLEALVGDARKAALNAGFVRFRPVLMTALAMIIGMMPMALGLGEGGEQNAPLGRAVIGGLTMATIATLFFVPVFFSVVHSWLGRHKARPAYDTAVGADLDEFDQQPE